VSGIVETKSQQATNQSLKTKSMSQERDTKNPGRVLFFQLGLTGGQDYWPDSGTIPYPPKQVTGVRCQYVIYLLTICTRTKPSNKTMKDTKGNLQRKERDIKNNKKKI
jgi:hypothetical protein